MGYILDLRKKVGHDPLLSLGAATLIFNAHHDLLLVHRTDNQLWGLPAGSTELGEDLVSTAKREVLEETGLAVTDLELIDIYSGERGRYVYPNGDVIYSVTALYQTTHFTGQLTAQAGEVDRIKWWPLDQLGASLTPLTQWLLSASQTR
ncbi:phosphohydrolase [Levilactobacillus bambusae]|uniref:Phosphohydrolase n=1 Tax=Levilactobacillus bambusae TaxID=2024736 RepID=A0A2V1MYY4_9LACO|nr:phosphohydrolase [Levilactobacillus bambusae]